MNKKTILIIVLSVLVILVNSFTAVVLYKKLSADHKSADSHINDTEADADVTDENKEVSYYGKPSQIIVFGNGKEYSIDSSDAYYQEILEYNETAMRSAPTLAGHEFYDYKNLKGEELKDAIRNSIKSKQSNLVGAMASQGTTPRQLTDLIGSLCDLTSGSGDKGTPIILIKGYFDNYTND